MNRARLIAFACASMLAACSENERTFSNTGGTSGGGSAGSGATSGGAGTSGTSGTGASGGTAGGGGSSGSTGGTAGSSGGAGGASGGAGGASGGAGGGSGGATPIMVNCGAVNCDVANGQQCCYDEGTKSGVCQKTGAACTSATGSSTITCDQKADCATGVCCLSYDSAAIDISIRCTTKPCPFFINRSGTSTQQVCSTEAECPPADLCKPFPTGSVAILPVYKRCE